MNLINKSFAGIVKSLDRALASNNLEQARASQFAPRTRTVARR